MGSRPESNHMRLKILLLLILCTTAGVTAQTRKPVRMPRIQTVGDAIVWRISDNKDEHGGYLPPWKEVQITNIFGFRKKPVINSKVTIVPLDVDVAPMDLKITGIKEREACGSHWWDVELETVKAKLFFDTAALPNRTQEFPFDVGVIYPAVSSARQIRKGALRASMLPKGVSLNTVKGAIDLTGDGIPDALLVAYCCRDPQKPARECDYSCSKTFRKMGNVWRLVNTSSPC